MKKFDFCIGNPPYQAETEGENDRKPPVYDKFMDAAFAVANCVELIHPARFLFNAGQTSKAWNNKMLSDPHFKVLHYEADASNVFANTDIKGGVAITLHDANKHFGSIGVFTKHSELTGIVEKVNQNNPDSLFFDSLVSSRGLYRFSPAFYSENPEASSFVGEGTGNMLVSNSFDVLGGVFEDKSFEGSLCIVGRQGGSRRTKYIKRKYVLDNPYIDKYKVLMAEANGTGAFGEALSSPFVSLPGEGAVDTFISIGPFDNELMAVNVLAYIRTKFARALLGVNKATQHNPKSVWKAIPVQDFTPSSDIDWSKSIAEIDRQLYKKYGLSDEEITFIETHVKEMA